MSAFIISIIAQTALIILLAPFISGVIRTAKANLQNRRGPPVWQTYADLLKLFRKDMVLSEHASWIFGVTPYVVFATAIVAGLLVPMVTAHAPLRLFGDAIALVGLLALGRFFLALAGLDPASSFGGMGSSREMSLSSVAEPALMLCLFTLAILAGSTDVSAIVNNGIAQRWPLLNPANPLIFASLFIVLLAETGRVPVDNPATHLELTMIHEGMVLEYSGRHLALLEWGASIKQFVLMSLLVNIFFPIGLGTMPLWLEIAAFVSKLIILAAGIVVVETVNAKLRLFRVPNLLSGAFVLAGLALLAIFIFQ
ncbi:MAG: respiratory chain complex I subunit 1 family protein [Limisphaerales bacterium]